MTSRQNYEAPFMISFTVFRRQAENDLLSILAALTENTFFESYLFLLFLVKESHLYDGELKCILCSNCSTVNLKKAFLCTLTRAV